MDPILVVLLKLI